jgi:hypothetical protein
MRLLVAVVLAVWEPLAFVSVTVAMPTLIARGPLAILEFGWAALVACLSATAAWAVWSAAPSGATLARAAIVAAVLRDLQALWWTSLPSNVVPGTRLVLAAGSMIVFGVTWLANDRAGRARS